ncbi:MAG: hypothetical protein ACJAX3_000608 [Patiriisocius sp.]|jgi:hypothetical protein
MSLNKKPYFLFIGFLLVVFISCGSDDETLIPDPPQEMEDDPMEEVPVEELVFLKTYGGSGIDKAVGVVEANDGNYMILATTESADGDVTGKTTTDSDYWLLKVSPQGDIIYNRVFGGSADDEATNITKSSDGGFLLSGYSRSNDGDVSENSGFQDFWVLKLDSNATIQWEKSFGFPGGDQAFKIFETSQGNYFVTGFLDVSASGGDGNDATGISNPGNTRANAHGVGEYWGILLDQNGNKIWRRYFGGTNNDRSYDAIETPEGHFIMVGTSESEDFDVVDPNGSYDFWIVKVSNTGDLLWSKSYGGAEIDNAFSIAPTLDGNFITVGDTRSTSGDVSANLGNADAWIVKFSNANGSLIWEKSIGGSAFDSARGIVPTNDGKFLICGNTRSNDVNLTSNNGQNDAWIVIIDGSGNITYQKTLGGSELDFTFGILETSDNKIVAVGDSESNDFDIPENKGIKDVLVIKLNK